ncbi:acyl-CoA dehydrogenase family protein [Pelagibacteraceae bacterium]|jgi:acyl-CoA dehydrogenase|nr:acyl-CoA dehydrogenase family protein [Pelagibacteraceae bacterium]MDA9651639.1 acyl-CoA dehydrogenase family protein [Pelagibacteraceae bacterium]MDA9674902.1 acyl-CoA dehydrogenase family protein [Pelagibacteraceae bacterium]MDC1302583.1 acyl-CoA dehydrogenase family protein [Pelagibacterales bacterium]|tara:strand:- start:1338 stop:2519 length:1182 start_codon:yes stop_codon:yes gene_type:complete
MIPPAGIAPGKENLFYNESHHAWREELKKFVAKEIAPFVEEWEEAGEFPRELYKKAGDFGLLGMGYPEQYGGTFEGIDIFHGIVTSEELAQGSGGIAASLLSLNISLPLILALGTEEQKEKYITPVIAGDKIACLGVTEPSGGSDVAGIKTKAIRDGSDYILNGSKMFITSGMRADYYVIACRTGGPGTSGISAIVVEKGTPGFTQTPLKKMGWLASDTAVLYFDDCRVPAENLIGGENSGWAGIMSNFSQERLGLAAGMNAYSQICIDESVAWARDRMTFGKPLIENQVIRHKLSEMSRMVNATKAYMELLTWRVMNGEKPTADLSLLKVQASKTMEYCAREAMQILGGAGYLRANSGPGKVERIYREVRVNAIGGGSEEIMLDLAAKQLKF